MTYFIGYRIDGFDSDDATPIATGRTREEAQGKAIQRVLGLCDINASIGVQQKDITEDDFNKLTELTDEWAKKLGLES